MLSQETVVEWIIIGVYRVTLVWGTSVLFLVLIWLVGRVAAWHSRKVRADCYVVFDDNVREPLQLRVFCNSLPVLRVFGTAPFSF